MVGCAAAAATLLLGTPSLAGAAANPSITITDVTVAEGDAGTTLATFTINASPRPRSCCALSVAWATANGTASTPSDYTAASGTVTLTRIVSSKTVSVPVNGDTIDENNETFVVNLSSPSNATIGDAQGVATITDDDPLPPLSVNDVSVAEGNAGTSTATFTVSLSTASGRTVTVDWATADGTAIQPADYASGSGSLTFVPGDTSETVAVTVKGDVIPELDETFSVQLSNASKATIADAVGSGTILDDELEPVAVIDDAVVAEGDSGTTPLSFTVTLSNPSGSVVTIDWVTNPGTAIQGTDYTDANGTVTFVPGDITETVNVLVHGDTSHEADETFTVDISNPVVATIADTKGTGTITNDDPLPAVSVNNVSVSEGDAGTSVLSFTVSALGEADTDAFVHYTTVDASATAGSDYTTLTGTLTIPAGSAPSKIDVLVIGDLTHENNEHLTLVLSDPAGATIADGTGTGTITNDDPVPKMSIGDVTVLEGTGTSIAAVFTVTLSAASGLPATVGWSVNDGTAWAPSDYTDKAGTLTFAAGATSRSISVTVKGDRLDEPRETFTVDLSGPTGAAIADGTGIGTIRDDDKTPTSVTVDLIRGAKEVKAKGLLETARTGNKVTVTLLRKRDGVFRKITSKIVSVGFFRDRDGDGKTDGSYSARFARPRSAGTYRFVTTFLGSTLQKPCHGSTTFVLPAI